MADGRQRVVLESGLTGEALFIDRPARTTIRRLGLNRIDVVLLLVPCCSPLG
ncbi:MAG: hypothetical protein M3N97_09145 [Pseudomonadota bacterium]|nr:hypothetical protein [Pseudomonadota bacterium]